MHCRVYIVQEKTFTQTIEEVDTCEKSQNINEEEIQPLRERGSIILPQWIMQLKLFKMPQGNLKL